VADDNKLRLEIAHVLFIDIVGYSKLLIDEQSEALRDLNRIVRDTAAAQTAESLGQLIRLPTGDGMALVFTGSIEAPVECALEISEALRAQPNLPLRMGIHSGPINRVPDVNERESIAGAGINIAQRVMDCGDAGHILLSKRVADDLAQYRRWQPYLHDLGDVEVKHGMLVSLVNFQSDDVGNPNPPGKFTIAKSLRPQSTASPRVKRLPILTTLLFLGVLLFGLAVAGIIFTPAILTRVGELKTSVKSRARSGTSAAIPVSEKSIAVLPFENLSADKSNAYFAAGIRDEILTRLANLGELKVIARTSTEKYESHPADIRTIGAELGVAHLLEGSVQKVGNEVHVNVQLIEANTGAHVWAQSYDRTLERVFAVEGEVAQTVANELEIALLPAQIEKLKSMPTNNAAAYDAYLKGDYALEQARKNPGDYQSAFEPAIQNLQEATTADPQFALAFARLAYAQLTKEEFAHLDGRTEHQPQLLASAKQNIDRALQLQPNLPDARLALGRWYLAAQQDRATALKEYERALELDPGLSEATARIGSLLLSKGRTEEAIELYRKGLESDPRNYQLLRNLGIAYTMRRDYKQGAELDARIVAMDPADELDSCNLALDSLQTSGDLVAARKVLDNLISHLPAGRAKGSRLTGMELMLLILGRDYSAAKSYAETIPPQNWETKWARPMTLGDIESNLGNKVAAQKFYETARELLTAEIKEKPEESEAHADLALAAAGLGQADEALREAQRAIELAPVETQARTGLQRLVNLAAVNSRLGNKDEAIAMIERVLAMPNTGEALSLWQLRLEPVWDPLRGDPRFEKIVAGVAPK
jgi:TolB-like protein/Tfp pilus assembly protein PilF